MKDKIHIFPYLSVWLVIPILLGGIIPIPIQSKAIAQVTQSDDSTSTQLGNAQNVTEQFITSLVQGEFEQARQYLSPSLREYISATDLQQKWQKLLGNMGEFVQFRQIRPVAVFDTYTVLVTANFQNSISDFVVTLDRNQQITAFDYLWLGNVQTSAEEFVDALSTGRYGLARSYLSPELKETFLPETLQQRWQTLLTTTGPFKQRSSSQVVRSSDSEVVVVNLEFENYTGSFAIVFNLLGQIVGVDFPQKQG